LRRYEEKPTKVEDEDKEGQTGKDEKNLIPRK